MITGSKFSGAYRLPVLRIGSFSLRIRAFLAKRDDHRVIFRILKNVLI